MYLNNIVPIQISRDLNCVTLIQGPANMVRLLFSGFFGHCRSLFAIGYFIIYINNIHVLYCWLDSTLRWMSDEEKVIAIKVM